MEECYLLSIERTDSPEMKSIAALFILLVAMPCLALGAEPTREEQEKQVQTLVNEVHSQQVLIAQNQAQIEAKLAVVAESVRIARIYAARAGRGKGK